MSILRSNSVRYRRNSAFVMSLVYGRTSLNGHLRIADVIFRTGSSPSPVNPLRIVDDILVTERVRYSEVSPYFTIFTILRWRRRRKIFFWKNIFRRKTRGFENTSVLLGASTCMNLAHKVYVCFAIVSVTINLQISRIELQILVRLVTPTRVHHRSLHNDNDKLICESFAPEFDIRPRYFVKKKKRYLNDSNSCKRIFVEIQRNNFVS